VGFGGSEKTTPNLVTEKSTPNQNPKKVPRNVSRKNYPESGDAYVALWAVLVGSESLGTGGARTLGPNLAAWQGESFAFSVGAYLVDCCGEWGARLWRLRDVLLCEDGCTEGCQYPLVD